MTFKEAEKFIIKNVDLPLEELLEKVPENLHFLLKDFDRDVIKEFAANENNDLWDRFCEEISYKELSDLSEIQRKAVLCYWYDCEMGSGGFCGYMDCYPETDTKELESALLLIGNKQIAENYHKALTEGESDDWNETDNEYYEFSPSLRDCLENFIVANKDVLFD